MNDPAPPGAVGAPAPGCDPGEGDCRAAKENRASENIGRRRRPTLREADRLTDALRVTRAVLRRISSQAGHGAGELEAARSAIETADAVLGGAE